MISIVPPPAYMRECFTYNKRTGVLRWKVRPESHFVRKSSCANINGRCAGKVAGSFDHGYLRVSVAFMGVVRRYYVHRIAWCIVTGAWPELLVDHKDLNGQNNRWRNLRHATYAQNTVNSRARSTNLLGIKGVSAKRKKFAAQIDHGGTHRHLGVFSTPEEAGAAYLAAASEAHGEFARSAA